MKFLYVWCKTVYNDTLFCSKNPTIYCYHKIFQFINHNLTFKLVNVIYMLILILFFCWAVWPSIYNSSIFFNIVVIDIWYI